MLLNGALVKSSRSSFKVESGQHDGPENPALHLTMHNYGYYNH